MPVIDSPARIQEPVKRVFSDGKGRKLIYCACLVLALLPLARTCYVVATTGADCITNDDIVFVSLTESMLGGAYDWTNFFRDTFINGHCGAASQALLLVLGPLTSWNQYALCFIGIAMATARVYFTTRFLCSAAPERLYWPVLAIVSWMVFSFSQISIFTTGIFCVAWQSCLLFFTLGAYLLWRYPERLAAAIASSALGILACWNLALALLCWPMYFSIALLRAARKKATCMAIAAGSAIALAPYSVFVLSGASHSRKFADQFVHWFDAAFFVNALGRSFADGTGSKFGSLPGSELAGAIGVPAFLILAAVIIRSRRLRRILTPCFILCAWSIATLAMIGVVRSGVAPWYSLISACFWSGLAAASVLVLASVSKRNGGKYELSPAAMASAGMLITLAVWSWQSNRTYFDKQYFLENRAPISASILRNYEMAPEAFASYLFKLPGLSVAVTGKMLERNHWSVFSRHRAWAMQGDSIFPLSAGYRNGVEPGAGIWIRGRNETAVRDFKGPGHLNLCMQGGGVAVWRVAIPPTAASVVLKTSVAAGERAAGTKGSANWSIALDAEDRRLEPEKLAGIAGRGWQRLHLDLSRYRGRELSILFSGPSGGGAVVFEYPVIELIERSP